MKIAVEGCCHGELDKIYETVAFLEEKEGYKVDLLLICGDFQAVRNKSDLQCMAVPKKFQKLNTFYKYYSGEKKAPVLTIVIGGNHEASNYLQELPYGGWLAPNIYYLGYAGVVRYGGLRVGGMSGIYKGRDYARGHFEKPPYSQDTVRSVYHTRNLEVFRLKQLSKPVDIFISHDWPRGIYNYGNVSQLLQRKKFFKEEVENNTLGSPACEELLYKLQPDYWFSAHLHCKFPALVEHPGEDGKMKLTKFLALDKCLPRRQFLQVLDVPCSEDKPWSLELDPEWLCILKSTNHLLSLSSQTTYMPGPGCNERWDFTVKEEEIKSLNEDFGENYKIPENFKATAPTHTSQGANQTHRVRLHINPQTTLICAMLGITDPAEVFSGKDTSTDANISSLLSESVHADEISLGDSDDNMEDSSMIPDSSACMDDSSIIPDLSANPDEISLDDDDDEEEDEGLQRSITDSTDLSFSEGSIPPGASTPIPPGASTPHTLFDKDRRLEQPLCHSSPIIKSKMTGERSSDISTSQDCVNLSSTSDIVSDVAPINSSIADTTDAELQPPKVKKFKRRNEALYSSTTDDD